jgi:hypothetical protein
LKAETRILTVIVLLLLCPLSIFGQARVSQIDRALEVLSPAARAAVDQTAAALIQSTRNTSNGRIDRETGIHRTVYFAESIPAGAGDAKSAARSYLRQMHAQFGLSPDLNELEPNEVVESPVGHHVTFRQVVDGVPVYLGHVKVNLDRSLQPVSASNEIYQVVTPIPRINTVPSISSERARQIVREGVSNTGATTSSAELFVYPSDPPRLAWKVTAWPGEAPAEWVMLIDAHDGQFIHGFNAATQLHEEHPHAAGDADLARSSAPSATNGPSTRIATDGSGLVFDPDPLTSAGTNYGGDYQDNGDADSEPLNEQLFTAPLRDMTQRNGRYYLEGPYVRIVGTNPRYYPGSSIDSVNYVPPSETSPDAFAYTRAHNGFEAVNTYYHIDRSQRYLQELDPTFTDRPDQPIDVNPHGEGTDDNSFYYPSLNMISFGQGGVDDAEDAGVIWHEYGHVILDSVTPNYLRSGAPHNVRAFHEGWSDYWAASYRRNLATRAGFTPSSYDWRELFPWDAGSFWPGRRISHSGTYPRSLTGDDIYRDGLLWATTLMEIFTTLETIHSTTGARSISDQLNVQSHYFLPSNPFNFTFRDAAVALVRADLQLYDGEHRPLLLDHLEDRGFIDPSMYGPELSYDPDTGVSYNNGRLQFVVGASAREFSVRDVDVRYRRLGTEGPFQTVELTSSSDSLYRGEGPISKAPGLVEYYIEARDILGIQNTIPNDGAEQPLLTDIGTLDESSLLTRVQPTEGWETDDGGWRIGGTIQNSASLVLEPITLANNSDLQSYLVLRHHYEMECNTAGNVKISTDGGNSWELIHPYTDYPASNLTIPPLQGESGFCREDTREATVRAAFNLSDYTGQKIQLRIDFAAAGSHEPRSFWQIREATLYQATLDSQTTTVHQLALHSNYPNPVTSHTTVHFTIPSAGPVTMELYDTLGRRVRLIRRRPYPVGTHTVTFDRGNLANGIYFLQLTTPEGRVARPVRVIR